MLAKAEYLRRAAEAYDKYMELQARIDTIERRALELHGNKGVAAYRLRDATEYWLYRDLVGDRDIKMRVAQLNAAMAAAVA